MAIVTKPSIWAKAKALFEIGKSLSDINLITGIDRAGISRKAKKEGWVKGEQQPLIVAAADVKVKLTTLATANPLLLSLVETEITARTKHIEILTNMTLKNLAIMNKKVNEDFEMTEHKLFQETVNKASDQLLGKDPATVINNTNAQQAVFEPVRFTRASG
jgi:hypothetical protein